MGTVAVAVQIIVELKNDLAISGELHSVDQYLNVKLNNVRVLNENKYPHMVSLVSHFQDAKGNLDGVTTVLETTF